MSYRVYLQDWFVAQKEADHRYSHRLFARRAGVRSPSLLNEVIAGRRNLTTRTTEGFAEAMRLNRSEAAFFAALVQLDQAETPEEKNAAFDVVAGSRRFRQARPIEGPSFRYLSNWYYPAIRELALRPDFRPDPKWIAAELSPRIRVAEARQALDTLLELGMLVEQDGTVRPAEVSVATSHEVLGLAVHNYHHQMLERVSAAITGAKPAERHLLGVTVAIPESLVPALKQELDAMQERLLHLCDAHADAAERVYQLHLCLVPLSRGGEA